VICAGVSGVDNVVGQLFISSTQHCNRSQWSSCNDGGVRDGLHQSSYLDFSAVC